jgi:acetyl-CoA acetyltransferase
MPEAFICDYVRTPIGRFGGALAGVRADDLAAVPLKRSWRAVAGWTGARSTTWSSAAPIRPGRTIATSRA